jgi:MYXO-CTERM domain-containing protein
VFETWQRIRYAYHDSPSLVTTVTIAVGLFLLVLLVAGGLFRRRARQRKRIKKIVPTCLANPMESQNQRLSGRS